jgi:hypothetical protein
MPMAAPPNLEGYTSPGISEDKLRKIREAAEVARQFELDIQDLEARLAQQKANLHRLYSETLPDLMDEAQVDNIGLPAKGNLPAVDLTLEPFYRANIAASWSDEKRQAAFDALTNLGHEDLIKTSLQVDFSRTERQQAMKVYRMLKEQFDLHPALRENVHFQTLTAWLREQWEAHKPLPPLDVIGATVGRVAKFKERRER